LETWRHDLWALRAPFSDAELARLDAARTGVRKDRRTVVFCVYENRFAKAGGLFSVASHLPPAVQRRGDKVLVLSPLHARLSTAPQKPDVAAGLQLASRSQAGGRAGSSSPRLTVTFGGTAVDVIVIDLSARAWTLRSAHTPTAARPSAAGSPTLGR
jgi:hypothetical protein